MKLNTRQIIVCLTASIYIVGCRENDKSDSGAPNDAQHMHRSIEPQRSVPLTEPFEINGMKIWADRREDLEDGINIKFSGHVRVLSGKYNLSDAIEDPDSTITISMESGRIVARNGDFRSSTILGTNY